MTPCLSLITITKDDPAGLGRTLASTVAWRAWPGVEQVVVYVGVEPAMGADGALRVCRQESAGIAAAFNQGLDCARGRWVWFLNGGDEIDPGLKPEWLLTLLAVSRAEVLIGEITYASKVEGQPHPTVSHRWPPIQPWIPHPAALVRRDLFERFGRFDTRYAIAMDYEWWLRVLPAGVRVDVLSLPFARFADGGISQRPETRRLVACEKHHVIRRYALRLWKAWLQAGARLCRDSTRALFSRRTTPRE